MATPRYARAAALVAVWSAAVLLALGSETFPDDEPDIELPPVTVSFDVSNSGVVRIEDGSTVDTVTGVTILGNFEKAANDRITLRQVPVLLDTGTAWAASVLRATDPDNALTGDFVAAITDTLQFGINRQPAFGQFSSDFDGTTTLVTFSNAGANVTAQTGTAAAVTLGFQDFRGAFTDTGQSLDLRMASKAYGVVENLWQVTRISETLYREVEQQLGMLESVGLQTSLELPCDNPMSMNTPSFVMRWNNDVVDVGSAGNGDNFTANWRNCFIEADGRWLEADLDIDDYQLFNDVAPRSLSYIANARSLFFAMEELEPGAFPDENAERVDGSLVVSASEDATVTPTR